MPHGSADKTGAASKTGRARLNRNRRLEVEGCLQRKLAQGGVTRKRPSRKLRRSAELLRRQSSIRRRQVKVVEEVQYLDAKGKIVPFARAPAANTTHPATASTATTAAASTAAG